MSCKVHNVRFYKPEARAIHCMAYEAKYCRLALSRADSTIEVWDLSYAPNMQQVIPGSADSSVEAMVWCNKRLFSTGLHGMVAEYNLATLSTKYEVPVTSGPAWCIAVNRKKTRLAAGTEDGYVNIFDILDASLTYVKLLDKQEGRILCLAWNHTGDVIATGSSDSVRLWSVNTGHAVHLMTTGRATRNKETIVWCVTITDDGQVISGDSRGFLCVWDAAMGTQVQKIKSHVADILCLTLADDQNTVYCSGVDPVVASFSRGGGGGGRWVRGADRRLHNHDVRAMLMADQSLVTGGVDGYLALSSYPPKLLLKYPPVQPQCVSVSARARCLLLRHSRHAEVWRLGAALPLAAKVDGVVPLEREPLKLLHLAARGSELIVCCAMSADARWIAYSTPTHARLFSLSLPEDERPRLERVSWGDGGGGGPAHAMLFTPDCKQLLLVTKEGDFRVAEVSPEQARVVHSFRPHDDQLLRELPCLLTFSPTGQYLVAADPGGSVSVWSTHDWSHYCSLPRLNSSPTAMSVQADTDNLVVVYANRKIIEFCLSPGETRYTRFSRDLDLQHPRMWLERLFPVTTVTHDPRRPDVILLHDDNTVYVVEKNKKLPTYEAKIPRVDSASSDNRRGGEEEEGPRQQPRRGIDPECAFHMIKKYKHLVYLGWLDGDEMVAVEVTPTSLEENLPPTLKKKKFGVQ